MQQIESRSGLWGGDKIFLKMRFLEWSLQSFHNRFDLIVLLLGSIRSYCYKEQTRLYRPIHLDCSRWPSIYFSSILFMGRRVGEVKHLRISSNDRRERRGRARTNDGLMDGRNGFPMSLDVSPFCVFPDETIGTAIGFSSNSFDTQIPVIHPMRQTAVYLNSRVSNYMFLKH